MNAMMVDCDECNAEAGEPCREWCIGEAEAEDKECTHSLCIEGTRTWPAKYKITQLWQTDQGTPITRVTWTCTHHTEVMLQILGKGDKIQRLHARGE